MKVLCITGPPGSGKTTLSKYLSKKYRIPLIEMDRLGHLILELDEIKKKLAIEFDDPQLEKLSDKALREKLKKHLRTAQDWKKLESVVHPYMKKYFKLCRSLIDTPLLIVDVAIPFTLGIEHECDLLLKIEAPQKALIERLKERGMDIEFAQKIIDKQKKEIKYCDISFENAGDLHKFLSEVDRWFKNFLKTSFQDS